MNEDGQLNGRLIWRGKDDVHDPCAWARALSKSGAQLYDDGDTTIWLDDGERVQVGFDALRQIIKKHIAFPRPVNRGTAEAPNWQTEYFSTEPDDQLLRTLLTASTAEAGSLAARLPAVPRAPSRLTPQQERDAVARLRTGERPDRVADAYRVPLAEVTRLGSGR